MKRVGISLVIVAVMGFFVSMEGQAATYRYTDKDGNVGLADDLQAIPEAYRASAVLISGDAKEGSPTPDVHQDPAQQNPPIVQPNTFAPVSVPAPVPAPEQSVPQVLGLPFSIRLAISIGVIIASIFASVFLGKVSAMHGHDRAIHILRVSLTWLVMVYLVAAHAKDVMTLVKAAGSHVQSVSEESAKRGEKAAKVIKSLDAAMEQAAKQAHENEQAVREAEQAAEK